MENNKHVPFILLLFILSGLHILHLYLLFVPFSFGQMLSSYLLLTSIEQLSKIHWQVWKISSIFICYWRVYVYIRTISFPPLSLLPFLWISKHMWVTQVASDILITVAKFLLLHDRKEDDSIKNFFTEVHELFVKVCKFFLCTQFHHKSHR